MFNKQAINILNPEPAWVVRPMPSSLWDETRLRIWYFIERGKQFMFANPNFTRKNAPVFLDSCIYAEDAPGIVNTGMRIHIMNDGDIPPKALIEFDIFLIPLEDLEKGDKWKKTFYDLAGCICLSPEDAMKVIRRLNYLLSELFKDHNYINDSMKAKSRKKKK